MFYLTTHSTHFIYGYMASDIWLRTILIVRKKTRCRHIGYCYRLTARVLLYAPSHRQDNTYHGLCYSSREALAGTKNSSMGPPHKGSIRRPIALWANFCNVVRGIKLHFDIHFSNGSDKLVHFHLCQGEKWQWSNQICSILWHKDLRRVSYRLRQIQCL